MFKTMLAYNILATIALLALIAKNPRYMMQDYPPEITAGIPPQTREEKKAGTRYGLPFILVLIGLSLVTGLINKLSGSMGFLENFLCIFALMFSFNLVDLILLDWLIFCTLTPDFMVLPGTNGHAGYKNYGFHFIGFLKGTLICAAGSLVVAGLCEAVAAVFSFLI